MPISSLWPLHHNQVFARSAESQIRAINLALHQPVNVVKKQDNHRFTMSDQDFVDDFIAPKDEPHHLVFLEGAAGVGKSHLVIWTQAKLEILNRTDEYRDRFIIVRIPRAKGVRYILEKIYKMSIGARPLIELLDDTVRDQLEQTIGNFQNTVDINNVNDFTRWLDLNIISEMHHLIRTTIGTQLIDHLNLNLTPTLFQELLTDLALMFDRRGLTQNHLLGANLDKPLVSIIRTLLAPTPGPEEEVQDVQQKDTLLSTSEIRDYIDALDEAGLILPLRITDLIDAEDDDAKLSQITTLFNHYFTLARDKATENMMSVDLQNLFLEIRRAIKRYNDDNDDNNRKELILLHEDLKTAQGTLDLPPELKTLLDVAIDTSDQGDLCMLRTMVAYTPGATAWNSFDTHTSRADNITWEIQPKNDPFHFQHLVARFCNAGRFGRTAIEEYFDQNPRATALPVSRVQQDLTPTEQTLCRAYFGMQTYSLFPFNPTAIDVITASVSQNNNFANTREVLSKVNNILKNHQAFMNGNFPGVKFEPTLRITNPATHLRRLMQSCGQGYERGNRFLNFWGIMPRQIVQDIFNVQTPDTWPVEVAQIDYAILDDAANQNPIVDIIPPIQPLPPQPTTAKTPPTTVSKTPPTLPKTSQDAGPEIWSDKDKQFFTALQEWSNQTRLDDKYGKNLRKDQISKCIEHFYHWNIPNLKNDLSFNTKEHALDFLQKFIYIPNAGTQNQQRFQLTLLTQEEYDSHNNARRLMIYDLLLSIYRLSRKKFQPTYDEFVEDYARVHQWVLSQESALDAFFSIDRHAYPNALPDNHLQVTVHNMLTAHHLSGTDIASLSPEERLNTLLQWPTSTDLSGTLQIQCQPINDTIEQMWLEGERWLRIVAMEYQSSTADQPNLVNASLLLPHCESWAPTEDLTPLPKIEKKSDVRGIPRGTQLHTISQLANSIPQSIKAVVSSWDGEHRQGLEEIEQTVGQNDTYCPADQQQTLYQQMLQIQPSVNMSEFDMNTQLFTTLTGPIPKPTSDAYLDLRQYRIHHWENVSEYRRTVRSIDGTLTQARQRLGKEVPDAVPMTIESTELVEALQTLQSTLTPQP